MEDMAHSMAYSLSSQFYAKVDEAIKNQLPKWSHRLFSKKYTWLLSILTWWYRIDIAQYPRYTAIRKCGIEVARITVSLV